MNSALATGRIMGVAVREVHSVESALNNQELYRLGTYLVKYVVFVGRR